MAYDSADVWANSGQFELDAQRRPSLVAGVPPDYFLRGRTVVGQSAVQLAGDEKGQLFLVVKKNRTLVPEMFDVIRIDHFRAFDSYYAIKYGEKRQETAFGARV